jgi:hypothetical protein
MAPFCDPANGACGAAPVICNDGDPCTNDSCTPGVGCQHVLSTPLCVAVAIEPLRDGKTAPSGTASFSLAGNVPHVSYACKLNGVSVDCTSIYWSGLSDGSSLTVEVTATDLDTNTTGPEGRATAEVDANPPSVVISAPTDNETCTNPVNVLFSSSESSSSFVCSLNGAPITPCQQGGVSLIAPLGFSCFTVQAIDAVGNSSVPDTVCFVVQ